MKTRFWALVFLFLLAAVESIGQNIIRGPYIQMNTPTSTILRWRTDNPTDSKVWYGDSPGNLTLTKFLGDILSDHEIQITGLTPNTTYYYAVGNAIEQLAGANDDHYFKTSPNPGSTQNFDVWILGDAGEANESQRSVRDGFYSQNKGTHTDLILALGDNAYSDGTDREYQYAWFEDMYEASLINSPLWSTVGNHDVIAASSETETGPYYDIFNFPRNGEAGGLASGTEAWYSFDYANVHFVCLNSEDVDVTSNGPMLAWLENDLAITNQEWIVAYFHKPPFYNSLKMFSPILEAAGVDLVFYGHVHDYQRSFLMNGYYDSGAGFDPATMTNQSGDGRLDGDGPYDKSGERAPRDGTVYVLTGSAGSVKNSDPSEFQPYHHSALGSIKMSVSGGQLDVKFIDNQGSVLDYFTMIKKQSWASITNPLNGAAYFAAQTINMTATAADPDGTIVQVEFFVDGLSVGVDTSHPYSVNWTPTIENYYDIQAVSSDNDGNSVISSAVKIKIIPPTGSLDIPVNFGSDDAEEQLDGNLLFGSYDIEMTNDGGVDQIVGLRFNKITLPPNASILKAYVQFTADEVSTGNASLLVEGEAIDNAPAFIGEYNISERSRTIANATWNPPEWNTKDVATVDQQTADISSIIKEIVRRPGWVGGNSIVIIISGTGRRTAEAYDGVPASAARLYLEYSNICDDEGQSCNDGNNCTENDVYDADCNCVGTYFDSDNDTVCDMEDQCPGFDDLADADSDGISDGCDFCYGSNDILEVTIRAKDDDVEEQFSGVIKNGSTDLELTDDAGADQIIGLRFNNIILPPNASIKKAYVQFTADEVATGNVSLLIEGEAADNAPAFTIDNYNVSSRSRTTASVAWSPPEWNTKDASTVDQQTADISLIIEEIVSRTGWVSGNSIVIIITGTGRRTAKSHDGAPSSSAKLHIEQIVPSTCDLHVSVRPNPFQDDISLFIQRPDEILSEAVITIMNNNGNVVYQRSDVPLEQEFIIVPPNDWADGLYFIRVQTGNYLKTIKVIKQ